MSSLAKSFIHALFKADSWNRGFVSCFRALRASKLLFTSNGVLCLLGIPWQNVVSLLLKLSWKYLTETFLNCFDHRDRCCSVFLHYYTTRRTEIRDGCKVDHQVVHYQNISCFVFFSLSWTNILILLVGWILYHLLNNALFVEQTPNWISKENYFTTSIVKCWLKTWTFNSELDFRCQDVTIAVELQSLQAANVYKEFFIFCDLIFPYAQNRLTLQSLQKCGENYSWKLVKCMPSCFHPLFLSQTRV